jgi:hypothetical protein
MRAHFGAMSLGVATKQAAMNARMQGLHPPIQHLGPAGEVAHLANGDAGVAQSAGGAAGRKQLDTELTQPATEVDQAGLVRNREKSARRLNHGASLSRR